MQRLKRSSKEAYKIQVTFNSAQIGMIDGFKGIFGDTRSEVVRYIVANWLLDNIGIKRGEKK